MISTFENDPLVIIIETKCLMDNFEKAPKAITFEALRVYLVIYTI
jgi:hypothetical protein|tara:strand:+ start:357 stop:491 length:135 start_codon:yes stop_codon:yes gene_type:complete